MNNLIKTIGSTFIFISIFFLFSFLSPPKAEATHGFVICNGRTDCHRVYVVLCSNNTGTNWEVHHRLRLDDGSWTAFRNVWLNTSDGNSPCGTPYGFFTDRGYMNQTNSLRMQWWHSCVDPIVAGIQYGTGGIDAYADVTCKRGVGGVYSWCDLGNPNGLGSVSWDEQCPLTIPPPPPSVSATASCVGPAGRISVTWSTVQYSNGVDDVRWRPSSSSDWSYDNNSVEPKVITGLGSGTTYYVQVRGHTVSGRPGPTNWGQDTVRTPDCPPPAPPGNRQAPTFCQGTAGTNRASGVTFQWNPITYDSSYDVRYKRDEALTWTTITGIGTGTHSDGQIWYRVPQSSGCVTGPGGCSFSYNVGMDWQVRGHTSGAIAGPTAWSTTSTFTTANCAGGPNLTISAFSYPSGNAGGTANASVTILNNGAAATPAGFDVAVIRSVPGADCSTDETYTAANPLSVTKVTTTALAAGASRVLTIPVNQPNNAGNYTASAMVDADCNITEGNEGDNDRTDAYTLTSNISGNVFVDTNANGAKDTSEAYYLGGATVRVNGINYTTNATTGFYRSAELVAGSYGSAVTVPAGYVATTPTLVNPITIGPNTVVNFGIRQQFSISGNVYVDANNNGIKDTGEVNYSGLTVTRTGTSSGTDVTDSTSTNYSFPGLIAGTYTVSITAPSGYTAPVTSQTTTLGPSRTLNFRLVPRATVNIHVYNDNNGNGVEEVSETDAVGRTVTVTGGGAGTYTTNASGNVALTNLVAGSSTITVTVPSGWTATTANPRTVTYPPTPLTVNFGLRPPAPVCSGGLTANPTTVIPGQTSALRAIGCTSPTGQTLVYTWPAPDYGATTNVNSPNTTWTAPNPFWQQLNANPSVSVCNAGGGLCSNYGATITITPRFSATGAVFVDDNKDRLLTAGESNYTAGITISPNPAGVSVTYPTAGTYVINNMPGGVYTISYTSLPTGYIMTFPLNGPPPSFSIRVGNVSTGGACSIGGSNSAACDANGNITTLRYGITNSVPWIQSTGGDVTGSNISNPFGGGFNDQIPAGASCGSYASLAGSGGTPGIIHSGAGSALFGAGQASTNPYNWVVGGLTYPDVYIPSSVGVIKTSYNYMSSIAQQSGLTPVNIAGFCGGGGISNCTLSTSLPNGIYISNGDLTLTGASYTFPGNRNFVILVNGDLSIQTEVHVPVGSTALFSSSRDITVASTVGEVVTTSTRANVEGYYSADRDFKVLGINSCPTSDRRLNVAGSIVVNAALGGGAFSYERDFCAGNLECPVFQIQERADFILNSPEFIKATRRVWREVAP